MKNEKAEILKAIKLAQKEIFAWQEFLEQAKKRLKILQKAENN